MSIAVSAPTTTLTAVVRAADGVRFVTVGHCLDEIATALVAYIHGRCDDMLWPHAASAVHLLIEARRSFAAIATYFDHVGERWDEESLELSLSSAGNRKCDGRRWTRQLPISRAAQALELDKSNRASWSRRHVARRANGSGVAWRRSRR
jgi:hypothetical protein